MNNTIITCIALASILSSAVASPFAPSHTPELVVYSSDPSESSLHVETIEKDPSSPAKKWTFPSSYTGHRSVCRLPGATTNDSFCAWIGGEQYAEGNPFGVSSMREYPTIILSRTSAISPRLNVWEKGVETASDRAVVFGKDEAGHGYFDALIIDPADPKERALVTVSRLRVNGCATLGLEKANHGVIFRKTFESRYRNYLHEGDFLEDGKFDIDWDNLYGDIVINIGVQSIVSSVTNISYLVTFNSDPNYFLETRTGTNKVRACSTTIERRYEHTRTVPTPVRAIALHSATTTNCKFSFRIENEDSWASLFGTTYTAFKVNVYDSSSNLVWNSGIKRLPPIDKNGVYTFQTFQTFQTSQALTWRVALYNAKFKTDTLMSADYWGEHTGDPFSQSKPITVIGD